MTLDKHNLPLGRYIAEVGVRVPAGQDLSWIANSLWVACRRLGRGGRRSRVLTAVYCESDQRLTCLIAASRRDDVRDLLQIALLPPGRISAVVELRETVSDSPGD